MDMHVQHLMFLITMQTSIFKTPHWDYSSRDAFGSFSTRPTCSVDRFSPGHLWLILSPSNLATSKQASNKPGARTAHRQQSTSDVSWSDPQPSRLNMRGAAERQDQKTQSKYKNHKRVQFASHKPRCMLSSKG